MEYKTIRFERPTDHVARIVLDRPEVANALSERLFIELDDAVSNIESDDDIRVWIITGAPRVDGRPWFSAGADLREASHGPSPEGASRRVDPAHVVERIDALLKPSIAQVSGFCTTGALELVMACDLRIAGRSARLCDWHLKTTGLGLGRWGAAVRLSRLVGTDKAKELLLTGVEIDGDEAARIGLVNRCVDDEDLAATVIDMATTIAGMPRRGVRTTLGFLALQEDMSTREALRWAELTPDFMGLELRPFRDAAERFARERQE